MYCTCRRLPSRGNYNVCSEARDWPVRNVAGDVDDVTYAVRSETVHVERVLRVADVQIRCNERRRRGKNQLTQWRTFFRRLFGVISVGGRTQRQPVELEARRRESVFVVVCAAEVRIGLSEPLKATCSHRQVFHCAFTDRFDSKDVVIIFKPCSMLLKCFATFVQIFQRKTF